MIIDLKQVNGGGGGEYVLPKASATKLGGVKVGENLSIDADGVLSATGGGDACNYQIVDDLSQIEEVKDGLRAYVREQNFGGTWEGIKVNPRSADGEILWVDGWETICYRPDDGVYYFESSGESIQDNDIHIFQLPSPWGTVMFNAAYKVDEVNNRFVFVIDSWGNTNYELRNGATEKTEYLDVSSHKDGESYIWSDSKGWKTFPENGGSEGGVTEYCLNDLIDGDNDYRTQIYNEILEKFANNEHFHVYYYYDRGEDNMRDVYYCDFINRDSSWYIDFYFQTPSGDGGYMNRYLRLEGNGACTWYESFPAYAQDYNIVYNESENSWSFKGDFFWFMHYGVGGVKYPVSLTYKEDNTYAVNTYIEVDVSRPNPDEPNVEWHYRWTCFCKDGKQYDFVATTNSYIGQEDITVTKTEHGGSEGGSVVYVLENMEDSELQSLAMEILNMGENEAKKLDIRYNKIEVHVDYFEDNKVWLQGSGMAHDGGGGVLNNYIRFALHTENGIQEVDSRQFSPSISFYVNNEHELKFAKDDWSPRGWNYYWSIGRMVENGKCSLNICGNVDGYIFSTNNCWFRKSPELKSESWAGIIGCEFYLGDTKMIAEWTYVENSATCTKWEAK